MEDTHLSRSSSPSILAPKNNTHDRSVTPVQDRSTPFPHSIRTENYIGI